MLMPKHNRMSRRAVLGTALGSVFLAPFLRARRLEAQAARPKRLILAFTPDSHPPEWWPTPGSGPRDFTLNEPLRAFEGLEGHMLFTRRIDHSWSVDNHHEAGMTQLFTGQRFFDNASRYANGPSVDQVLLSETDLRGGTPIASIHLCAAARGGTDKRSIISYSGPGRPMAHQSDPARAFDDIFRDVRFDGSTAGATPTADAAAEARKGIRRSILQGNLDELRKIQSFLGRTEKEKLEAHVAALLELEGRLAGAASGGGDGGVIGGTCERADTSGVNRDDRNADAIVRWARAQIDILVNAFTCDVTRVAGFLMGFSGSHHNGMFGLRASTNNNSWHDNVAHISRTNDSITVGSERMTTRAAFIKFDKLFADQIAYLAHSLAAIPEGDGTMLDNTLIYWGVESGTNHNHSPRDMQYLLIGGERLGIQTGQFLEFPSTQSAHKLHTSVLHAFGYMAPGFGIEPSCGPLAGVVG
ncbi:MAG: DUF1552 domain-containing protein [Myxococcales bacterium]|jgi:hypothetical protein|nr:DUF1552 domain-containing protein [Myxococcales bacterium]